MDNTVTQSTSLPKIDIESNPAIPPATSPLSTRIGLVLVLLLSVFAVAPLFYPGYLQTHSGFIPLWNIVDLRANLGNLTWMPHVLTHFDPLRSGGLLPYYVAALLPLSPAVALKTVVGLGWLLGGVGLYLWLRGWLGSAGALVAALVYVYLPFQIVTVYVRGSWAESLFWGLLPWAILAATFLVTSPRFILLPVALCFWLALGLTQLGLTLWALLFLVCLVGVIHPRQAVLPVLSGVFGTGLAVAIYFVLLSPQWILPQPVTFSEHYLYPFQLVSAYWGTGISRSGWDDGLSLQLGLAALGLTIISVYFWRGSAQHRTDRRIAFFLSAAVLLLLPLLGWPGGILWAIPAKVLTYPWQLLGFVGLCLSVLAGAALWLEPKLTRLPLLAASLMLAILSVYPHLLPQFLPFNELGAGLPLAEFGDDQLALLRYNFAVMLPEATQTKIEPDQTIDPTADPRSIPLKQHGPLQPGDNLVLNVAWQPLQPFAENLKIFVHLVDANNQVLAQFDGQPQRGEYLTSQWIPGEIINDAYALQLPANASPGPYRVFIGLYNETTLTRLPTPYDTEGRAIFNVQ